MLQGPGLNELVQLRAVSDSSVQGFESPLIGKFFSSDDVGAFQPLAIGRAAHRQPPILAFASIDTLWRGQAVGGMIACSLPDVTIRRPVRDCHRGGVDADFALRRVDVLAPSGGISFVKGANDCGGKAVGRQPVEVRVPPTSGCHWIGHTGHFGEAREGGGDRSHRSKSSVFAPGTHARLLGVNDARTEFLQDFVAESQAFEHPR